MRWITRGLQKVLLDRMAEEQVVIVQGPRAAGKTTMVGEIARDRSVDLLDFGDDTVLDLVAQDPAGYLDGLPEPVIIDEYQRMPDVLRVVKRSVDRRPRQGAYVLTGSVTGSILPRGSESLTGRSHEMTLWGFSQGEIEGRRERFVDALFDDPDSLRGVRSRRQRTDYVGLVTRGGFPEAVSRQREAARRRWLDDYAARVVDRDLPEVVALRRPAVLGQVLRASAARTAQVLNVADLVADLGAGRDAVERYLDLLERVFLCRRLPAFSRNLNARLARRPKLHVTDSGLAAALVNLDSAALRRHVHFGALLESFVVAELVKQLGWAERRAEVLHYRDLDGHEVDVVLEATDGTVVAVEVKAATRVSPADFAGIRYLASRLGPNLVRGVVLFAGPASIQVGDDPRMRAMPIDALWTIGREITGDTTGDD